VNPKPVDASMPLLRQMRNHTSGHMFAMADRLNRAPRTVYAMTLAVAPRAQGTGAGHALVGWAARFADEHGAGAWIHLSDSAAGVRVLEKHGFVEVNRLAVNLDAYATKPRTDGGAWGTYTFRYFRREAQTAASPSEE
jgi:GNAT superfamily N-acetyltransferase